MANQKPRVGPGICNHTRNSLSIDVYPSYNRWLALDDMTYKYIWAEFPWYDRPLNILNQLGAFINYPLAHEENFYCDWPQIEANKTTMIEGIFFARFLPEKGV